MSDLQIHRSRFVTLPRSGHHWLIRMLQSVLGDAMRYSEYHTSGVTLESDPSINIQKCHDFDLSLKCTKSLRHVIQIRDIEAAMYSWWKMNPAHGLPLSMFRRQHIGYSIAFTNKWRNQFGLILPYEAMLLNPEDAVYRVIQYITTASDDMARTLAKRAALHEQSKQTMYGNKDFEI